MTIYDIQNARKMPIWKQRINECRSSGKSVKEWCKEHGLDFTTYYRWERKILSNIIPVEDFPASNFPALPGQGLPAISKQSNAIVKVELAPDPDSEEKIHFSQVPVNAGEQMSALQYFSCILLKRLYLQIVNW